MAQVTLNKNSWHFNYYSKIVSDTPPKSLCPYFWTMVLLTLISPIVVLIMGLVYVYQKIDKFFDDVVPKKQKVHKPEKEKTLEELIKERDEIRQRDKVRVERWNKLSNGFFWSVKYILLPLFVIFIGYEIFQAGVKMGWLKLFLTFGTGIVSILILFGLIWFFDTYGGRIGRAINPLNWKFVQIVGEMINVAYTKACPLITWEEENKTENDTI